MKPAISNHLELPAAWVMTSLGELKHFSLYGPRFSSEDYADNGVYVLRTTDISEGGKVNTGKAPKIPLSDNDFEKYCCKKGDLLITRTGSLGTLAVFNDAIRAIPGAYLIQYRLKAPEITSWYVFYFLKSPKGQRKLTGGGKGIGRPNLNAPTIEAIEIPLAPLPEQRRIVARIEELFSRLDAGVAALRHAKAQLHRHRQSVLAAAVTGQLTQAWREQHGLTMEDWRQTTLGDESALVTSGSRGWAKYYAADGPLFVRAQNIKTDALVLDDLAHVRPPAGSEGARTQVFEKDLLITITGANVTKSALVKQPLGEAYVSQHVALVRPVNPDYAQFLYYAIISPRNGRAFLEEKAYGAGKPGLNLTNVKEVPIGLPPLAEQHQIVAEVEARTTAIDQLEAELDRQITRSNRLRQSTLASAFNGTLRTY